ncbi:MAG: hypothetical protein JXR03_14885 [Cyclobacteriaceae bacterium]
MRNQLIVFLLLVLQYAAFAQVKENDKFSIQFEETKTLEALSQLESLSDWRFSYNPNAIPEKTITQSFEKQPIGIILNEVLGSGFEYKIRGSYLIIQKRDKTPTKDIQVKGRIVDSKTGKELENVSIYEVNNLTASLSGTNGSYRITAPAQENYTILAVSKINYKDTLITVSSLSEEPILLSLQQAKKPTTEISSKSRFAKFINNQNLKQHDENIELKEERLAQVSFLPVLGTNGVLGGKVNNKISLNVVAGYSYGTNGAEIGGVLNMNRGSMKGTQVAGVSNLVGDRADGVQIAGVSNTNLNFGSGIQLSGMMNSSGAFHGAQVSGAYNYTKHLVTGLQLSGAVNYAGQVDGLQLSGAINYTKELKGVQIGVVNIARKVDKGIMIGIINVAFENGIFRVELEHNDLTHYNVKLKTGTKLLHSVFSAGITPEASQKLWSYGMGFGSQLFENEKRYLMIDVTSNTIHPLGGYLDGLTMDNRLSISFGIKFLEHLSLNFGPVIHYYLHENDRPEKDAFYDSIGFKPFAKKSNQKAWLGYRVGVRF